MCDVKGRETSTAAFPGAPGQAFYERVGDAMRDHLINYLPQYGGKYGEPEGGGKLPASTAEDLREVIDHYLKASSREGRGGRAGEETMGADQARSGVPKIPHARLGQSQTEWGLLSLAHNMLTVCTVRATCSA